MTIFDILLSKYGTHEKLANACGKSRQFITYNNQSKDNNHRNALGLELMLKIGDEVNETLSCDGSVISIRINKI